ncbi:MAG: phosphoglucosamine mutase [Acidimicrobiia bacterium]|jgi:phosphoglucosamine mutase
MTLRFGTDGIRGVANRELTPELVTAVGRAAARVLGTEHPFVVGRDTRRSGPMLEAALVAGLCAEGADVHLAGVLPTPAVAELARVRESPAAMLTASHNPFGDNGVKLFAVGGRKLTDDIERSIEHELRELAASTPSGPDGRAVGVSAELRDAFDEYVAHVVGALQGRRLDGLRVVVDCANGASFRAAPRVLRELGAEVEVRNALPNGVNINDGCGSTDPSDLQRAVVESGANVGLAFDGDADRLIAVDETGAVVDGDQLLAIAAFDLQERGLLRHDAVVVTQMSNGGLHRVLREAGIEVVEVEVGDRNVLDALARNDLSLGGEQSGHIIYPDLSTTGDGILAGALLLDVLDGTGQPLSRLAAIVEQVPQVLRSIPVAEKDKLDTDRAFWKVAQEAQAELGEVGRILVRPSGTEPVVRVMVEAETQARADDVAARLAAAVERACGTPEG